MNWRYPHLARYSPGPNVEKPQPGRLPKPPHWNDPPPSRFRLAFVIYVALAVMAGLSLAASSGGFGIAQAVLPIWAAGLTLAILTLGRRRQLQATSNDYGSTLYPDRSMAKVLMVGVAVLCAVAMLYTVLVLAGVDMPPLGFSRRHRHFSQPSHSPNPLQDAIFTGFFGLAVAISLPFIWKRYTGNVLNLNPTGFSAAEKPPKTGRWDDVLDVLDFIPWQDPSTPPTASAPQTPIVFVMRDRSLQVLPSGVAYAPNGRAVFWMVRNYWLHPEERAELLNGVAIGRLTREDFPYA